MMPSVPELYRCERCGMIRNVEEIIVNFGLCDDCFEENCPCNDGHNQSCPLHRHPDVILSHGEPK